MKFRVFPINFQTKDVSGCHSCLSIFERGSLVVDINLICIILVILKVLNLFQMKIELTFELSVTFDVFVEN